MLVFSAEMKPHLFWRSVYVLMLFCCTYAFNQRIILIGVWNCFIVGYCRQFVGYSNFVLFIKRWHLSWFKKGQFCTMYFSWLEMSLRERSLLFHAVNFNFFNCNFKHRGFILVLSKKAFYPPASKASRKVANLNERKNLRPLYMVLN